MKRKRCSMRKLWGGGKPIALGRKKSSVQDGKQQAKAEVKIYGKASALLAIKEGK